MRHIVKVVIIGVLISSNSCNVQSQKEEPNKKKERVQSILSQIPTGGIECEHFLIIPLNGCGNCIDKTLYFLNRQIEEVKSSNKCRLIFTELSKDPKVNLTKLSPNFTKGFYLDSLNLFEDILFDADNIIPVIVSMQEDQVYTIETIDPERIEERIEELF